MMASLDYRNILLVRMTLIACSLVFAVGCSDPQADQRVRFCKGAGVTGDLLKACRRSWEEYNRIMEPIMARQEREEVEAFNVALQALPSRTIPKDGYESISIEKLNKEHGDLDSIEESKMSKHALFGKRFRVKSVAGYHPMDLKGEHTERVSLELEDANDPKNTWSVEADLESLSREERDFIKKECEYLFDGCHGEFFGVIGIVRRGEILQSLGMQIEYMDLKPRLFKKHPDNVDSKP